MMKKRVDEGAGGISSARVDDDSAVLVDDEKIVVFVENIDGDIFGLDRSGFRFREGHLDGVAWREKLLGLGSTPVEENVIVPDEDLEAGAGAFRELTGEIAVKADSGAILLCVFEIHGGTFLDFVARGNAEASNCPRALRMVELTGWGMIRRAGC